MATRDRNQGVYFVYSDAQKLQKKALATGDLESVVNPIEPIKDKVIEIRGASPMPSFKITKDLAVPKESKYQFDPSVVELKKSMNRLKHLQKKLRFMLSEIDQLVRN